MTATLTENPNTGVSVSAPTLTFDDLEDGIDLITRLVADNDAAHARLHLDIADRVRAVHDSDHPDLEALDAAGVTITGKPARRIRAALELVAYDYADALSLDPRTALDRVWEHWHAGTTHRALWQAVADRRITARQATTIRGQAQRLDKRTAVVTGAFPVSWTQDQAASSAIWSMCR